MIFGPDTGAAGASICIFGFLAIAMIWAPANELTVFVLIGWRCFTMEVTVYSYRDLLCVPGARIRHSRRQ